MRPSRPALYPQALWAGNVQYAGSGNDRDPTLVNVAGSTPNNIRVEQLPLVSPLPAGTPCSQNGGTVSKGAGACTP